MCGLTSRSKHFITTGCLDASWPSWGRCWRWQSEHLPPCQHKLWAQVQGCYPDLSLLVGWPWLRSSVCLLCWWWELARQVVENDQHSHWLSGLTLQSVQKRFGACLEEKCCRHQPPTWTCTPCHIRLVFPVSQRCPWIFSAYMRFAALIPFESTHLAERRAVLSPALKAASRVVSNKWTSVYLVCIWEGCIHQVQHVLSSGFKVHKLFELGEHSHWTGVIKIPRNHHKAIRVVSQKLTEGVVQYSECLVSISYSVSAGSYVNSGYDCAGYSMADISQWGTPPMFSSV